MSMHIEGPWLSTTGKKKSKQKFRSSEQARKSKKNQETWQELLTKHNVKPMDKSKDKSVLKSKLNWEDRVSAGRRTDHIPSLNTGSVGNVATKKETPQYTGDAMIGIGQLHKSNGIPIFSKEEATEISKMRRG